MAGGEANAGGGAAAATAAAEAHLPARAARRWSLPRLLLTLLACFVGWAAVAAFCLAVGSTGSTGWPDDPLTLAVRRESVLMASLVGAALAACGVAYQAVLRNVLADPFLLGVSSGAMLASYLWRLAPAAAVASALGGALGQQALAFAGAVGAVAVVLALAGARRGRLDPVTLLLVGVIVNSLCSSAFLLVNALVREAPGGGGPIAFLVGSIQGVTPWQQGLAAGAIGAGWLALLAMSAPLNAASLGEDEAQALGVRIHRLRWAALVVASLVAAAAVAVSGPIGFIGLVCPHLARLVVGPDVRRLLPVATAVGAALLALADALSRSLAGSGGVGSKLPVGVLTGLLGGPFFLLLLWQSRRKEGT